ncbi:MAG: acyloxyacyl hydrolase, partial [Bacteroidota bacterium]
MLKNWGSIWLICLTTLGSLSAQKLKLPSGSQVAVEFQQGNTLRHRETMVFALPRPARAYSLDIAREMDGSRAWHRRYGYPRVGFSAWMQDFGNQAVLGRSWSIHPFIDFNIWTIRDFRFRFRLAYGLTWIDQIHHPDTNPENNAIGSHINNVTSLGLLAEYWIAQRLIIRSGATLSHNSNGRLSVPNLGLNTAKLRVGVGYMLRPAERLTSQREA